MVSRVDIRSIDIICYRASNGSLYNTFINAPFSGGLPFKYCVMAPAREKLQEPVIYGVLDWKDSHFAEEGGYSNSVKCPRKIQSDKSNISLPLKEVRYLF